MSIKMNPEVQNEIEAGLQEVYQQLEISYNRINDFIGNVFVPINCICSTNLPSPSFNQSLNLCVQQIPSSTINLENQLLLKISPLVKVMVSKQVQKVEQTLNKTQVKLTQELQQKIINFQETQLKYEEIIKIKDQEIGQIKNQIKEQQKIEIQMNKNSKDVEFLKNHPRDVLKINQGDQQLINDFKIKDQEQTKLILDLRNKNERLMIELKEVEQQKVESEIKLRQKQEELEKCQESNEKNEEILKQLQQQSIVQEWQFSQSLTFSKTYKHNNLQVTQNAKVIENAQVGWCCAICDQMIPKNGIIYFAIKIIEKGRIMIGIGFRDIVQSKEYYDCYSIGGGTYNIWDEGYCYNHDQQDKTEEVAFSYSINDIIIVEVDINNKYITWKKSSTNQSFALTIDTSKDLYPCVHLSGQSKVEILNQLPQ
ncbi:unnamed protein product (macronuclear) [Paramecium tetraurelia]|uniref:B30.2/SPRY domain-containing protein n=1 Tax=Paramecium tetraurelia TaxID=5888 RepID=A0DEA7_PARTE|nr:uncharacterized protein GSPATT00039458001 [Paramecium tetraurelia]CAK81374.1 unnamed protein product [Paramecium tetraurelia]|eukprot:XP_001448771.1 hypothetical protein (macronuclear) [Paramecium tetraurelia strain d4-2]